MIFHLTGQSVNLKQIIIAALITFVSLPSFAEETRYISDNVFLYMHSGPGTQYRITGTVKAGETVTFLQKNADSGYAQIKTSRNKVAWIDGKYLTNRESLKVRTPKLQAELDKAKAKLATIKDDNRRFFAEKDQEISAQSETIAALTADNNSLKTEAERLRVENQALAGRLDTKEEDEQHRFFMLGAAVLAVGLLAGLIIPSLRIRKKSNNGWS